MTNLEFANGLRLIADFYEKHEGMQQFTAYVHTWGKAAFLKNLLVLSDGGDVAKDMSDTSQYAKVRLKRMFGAVALEVAVDKDYVCEKIVTYRCPDSLLEEAMNAEETASV